MIFISLFSLTSAFTKHYVRDERDHLTILHSSSGRKDHHCLRIGPQVAMRLLHRVDPLHCRMRLA